MLFLDSSPRPFPDMKSIKASKKLQSHVVGERIEWAGSMMVNLGQGPCELGTKNLQKLRSQWPTKVEAGYLNPR